MRLRLSDLEAARTDPAAFRGGGSGRGGGGFSTTRALQYAVYEYHRRGGDLPRAVDHFEAMYSRNLSSQTRMQSSVQSLREYDAQYRSLGNTAVRWGFKIQIPVTEGLDLSGEVGRLDIAEDGRYAVWILAAKSYAWENELRMPLIQRYMAGQMVVSPDHVDVGFYFFDLGEHRATSYNADELAGAARDAVGLAALLAP